MGHDEFSKSPYYELLGHSLWGVETRNIFRFRLTRNGLIRKLKILEPALKKFAATLILSVGSKSLSEHNPLSPTYNGIMVEREPDNNSLSFETIS